MEDGIGTVLGDGGGAEKSDGRTGTGQRNVSGDGDDEDRAMVNCHDKIRQLRDESAVLYEELINLRKDREQFYDYFLQQQNEALAKMSNDVEQAEHDIAVLESQMTDGREAEGEEDPQIAEEFQGEPEEPEVKQPRLEEEEAKTALEDLKGNVKKFKDQLTSLRRSVTIVQSKCKEEEKRNNEIQMDLDDLKRMQEKMRREDERIKAEFAVAAN